MTRPKEPQLVVDAYGTLIVASGGHISAPADKLAQMKKASTMRELVQVVSPFGDYVRAHIASDDPLGTLAAIVSISPGRWRLLSAPDEVQEWIAHQAADTPDNMGTVLDPECIPDLEIRDAFGNLLEKSANSEMNEGE